MDRVWPEDRVTEFDTELDLSDLLDRVADEFGIRISQEDIDRVDGSFDSLVRWVTGKLDRQE